MDFPAHGGIHVWETGTSWRSSMMEKALKEVLGFSLREMSSQEACPARKEGRSGCFIKRSNNDFSLP
jgi:hypothetical protein